MIAKIGESQSLDLPILLQQLTDAINAGDEISLVKVMKYLVPEYISSSSHFEHLDIDKQNEPPVDQQHTISQEEEERLFS